MPRHFFAVPECRLSFTSAYANRRGANLRLDLLRQLFVSYPMLFLNIWNPFGAVKITRQLPGFRRPTEVQRRRDGCAHGKVPLLFLVEGTPGMRCSNEVYSPNWTLWSVIQILRLSWRYSRVFAMVWSTDPKCDFRTPWCTWGSFLIVPGF